MGCWDGKSCFVVGEELTHSLVSYLTDQLLATSTIQIVRLSDLRDSTFRTLHSFNLLPFILYVAELASTLCIEIKIHLHIYIPFS